MTATVTIYYNDYYDCDYCCYHYHYYLDYFYGCRCYYYKNDDNYDGIYLYCYYDPTTTMTPTTTHLSRILSRRCCFSFSFSFSSFSRPRLHFNSLSFYYYTFVFFSFALCVYMFVKTCPAYRRQLVVYSPAHIVNFPGAPLKELIKILKDVRKQVRASLACVDPASVLFIYPPSPYVSFPSVPHCSEERGV